MVRARVEELLSAAAEKTGVSVEVALRELIALATSDIGEAVEWNRGRVSLKDSEGLSPHVRAAIAEVRQTRDGVTIKFHSKTAALEMIGRHLGMFKDRVEHSGKNGGPIEIADLSPLELVRRIAYALEKGRRELEGK